MKPLKLYLKVTVLIVAITVVTLGVAVLPLIKKISDVIILEKKEKTELSAISLATETGQQDQPNDNDRLSREAKIVKNTRYTFTLVRVYRLTENNLVEIAAAEGSLLSQAFTQTEILNVRQSKTIRQDFSDGTNSKLYRVIVPVKNKLDKVIGAVEIVSSLDASLKTIEETTTYLLEVITVAALVTLISFYLMMNSWVYKPLTKLLIAIQKAESGDLSSPVEIRAPDEIGLISLSFNEMLSKLKVLSDEKEKHQQLLTREIARVTKELWALTRQSADLEKLAVAGQTAAQFAHEVGTPLHVIKGHINILKTKFSGDEKASQKLEIILEQTKRIETIVRNMLDRTRKSEVHKEQTQINLLVEKICEAFLPSIEEKNIKLKVSLSPTLPSVYINKEMLQQALLNLMNNALDATVSGKIKVSTIYESTKNEIIIEIQDTGHGISSEIAKRIFDPLYTTKEKGKGTGLGLVIVQQVTQEHNGRVEFDSQLGKGTSFRLYLPINSYKTT
ncbi:MAG: HAMP domain-containing protein [Acidobacteria bacterium]|nr:HAMP domain-containing protein [Acidobacteriota bacterium]